MIRAMFMWCCIFRIIFNFKMCIYMLLWVVVCYIYKEKDLNKGHWIYVDLNFNSVDRISSTWWRSISHLCNRQIKHSLFWYIVNFIIVYIHICICIYVGPKKNTKCNLYLQTLIILSKVKKKMKLATLVEGDSKAPFLIATTPRCREGTTPFPVLPHFTFDLYLIMLSVKQGGIKYHFLSLW